MMADLRAVFNVCPFPQIITPSKSHRMKDKGLQPLAPLGAERFGACAISAQSLCPPCRTGIGNAKKTHAFGKSLPAGARRTVATINVA